MKGLMHESSVGQEPAKDRMRETPTVKEGEGECCLDAAPGIK